MELPHLPRNTTGWYDRKNTERRTIFSPSKPTTFRHSAALLNCDYLRRVLCRQPVVSSHGFGTPITYYDLTMDRDSLVYRAKLAEQAERFDEMVADMKEVAKQPQELTVEERNLLSVAYKNVIGSRRASWRVITSIEQKGDADKATHVKDYKEKIEAELVGICDEILSIILDSLVPNSTSEEAKVFYYKMKGDYHRYLSEFQVGETRKSSASDALDAYNAASGIAGAELPPTHPIRLGLALNFSVFYYGTFRFFLSFLLTETYRSHSFPFFLISNNRDSELP